MSDETPTVTCIIIFLDEERFLAEAIESVLRQSRQDFELLLVDDGSSDRSASIARAYAAADPERIRCLAHPGRANRGMSASRNLGLSHARGRFVAFLDGDDVWLPGKLAGQVALFDEHPKAAMVCGKTIYWRSWADGGEDETCGVGAPTDRMLEPPEGMKLLYPLGPGASPSTSGFMVRRDVALAVGGFEERFRGLFEDQAFKVKIYLSAPIFVSSRSFDRYRQHSQSCVQRADATGARDVVRADFFSWLRQYLEARPELGDRAIRRRVNRALLGYRFPRLRQAAAWCRRIVAPPPFIRNHLGGGAGNRDAKK